MKPISFGLRLLKRLLMMSAGVLGGLVLGILLCSLPLHLRLKYGIELPLISVSLLLLVLSSLAGAIQPRHFMHYLLCPLAWFLSDAEAPDGHPNVSDTDSKTDFIYQACYFIAVPLIVAGALLSITWLLSAGMLGLGIFALGIAKENKRP